MKTCCEHHGFEKDGCNGRGCPEGRFDIAAAWRYLCGYACVFARWQDHRAAKRAGHLAAITPAKPVDSIAWRRIGYAAAALCCVAWAAIYILERAQ